MHGADAHVASSKLTKR